MNWQKSMNQVLEYIEENLTGEIECSEIAKMMSCSEYEFRRMFSFFTHIPVSEYIRRRRLSQAGTDIQNGERIIDVALKYRYESQAAFSRAFTRFHGSAPSVVKKKAQSQILWDDGFLT